MVSQQLSVFSRIIKCIENKQNFVLQGGAGSGKTETLKKVLEYFCQTYPDKKVACITYTNLAADEIKSRVKEGDITVKTIHSFLHTLIKDYKKNIHKVIHKIYQLPNVERQLLSKYNSKKEWNKKEHDNYKKIHEKYSEKIFKIKNIIEGKAIGKTEYDKGFEKINEDINNKIDALNAEIKVRVSQKNYNTIHYSETKFSRLDDLSFGHDDLLKIVEFLCEEYPKLPQIIQDKYDLIFIDEYQDTTPEIIDIFLKQFPCQDKTVIGLFGDSMQSIYDKGIGEVENYIKNGDLLRIQKEDNFRCSYEVIELITKLRNDNLTQQVAFKEDEVENDRKGQVKCYYAFNKKNTHAQSSIEDKQAYMETINKLIEYSLKDDDNYKILMLTNRAISKKVNFPTLYNIFADRYIEPRKEIEEYLHKIQLLHLASLCNAYQNNQYNYIITELKHAGFLIKTPKDKVKIKQFFEELLSSPKGAFECLEKAFRENFIKQSDRFLKEEQRGRAFLDEISKNSNHIHLKSKYVKGDRNFVKNNNLSKTESDAFKKDLAKENFYTCLFSNELKFQEILNFYQYYIDETQYTTMHKTKGTGIENVLLVLDKFFWNDYNFNIIFDKNIDTKKKLKNQKIMYVAASRAKKNLICVKLVRNDEEEEQIKAFFENTEKIDLDSIGSN